MAKELQTEAAFSQSAQRAPGDFEFIRYQADGPVARVTLHRPEHNLLNEQMLRELSHALEMASRDRAVKMIVLDAAGKVFCAGVDIGEYTEDRVFSMLDAFHS